MFYASVDRDDRSNARAKAVLGAGEDLLTSDHILVETWLLLRTRLNRAVAERFWDGVRAGGATVEPVTIADLEQAWAIGDAFPDQDFSIVDRTSFALMQRLGVLRAAALDDDFAIFRFGRDRSRAFEVIR